LVVLLPSLEKAPAELASLGKISLSAIRNACAVGLGAQIEGDAADVLEALPTDTVGIGPYLCIVDEYAAIVTPGFEPKLRRFIAWLVLPPRSKTWLSLQGIDFTVINTLSFGSSELLS
jgi:hypothetical protein